MEGTFVIPNKQIEEAIAASTSKRFSELFGIRGDSGVTDSECI